MLVKTLSLRQLLAIVHHSALPLGPLFPSVPSIIHWSICRHISILKSLLHILDDTINCKLKTPARASFLSTQPRRPIHMIHPPYHPHYSALNPLTSHTPIVFTASSFHPLPVTLSFILLFFPSLHPSRHCYTPSFCLFAASPFHRLTILSSPSFLLPSFCPSDVSPFHSPSYTILPFFPHLRASRTPSHPPSVPSKRLTPIKPRA